MATMGRAPYKPGDKVKILVMDTGGMTTVAVAEIKTITRRDRDRWQITLDRPRGRKVLEDLSPEVVYTVYRDGADRNGYVERL